MSLPVGALEHIKESVTAGLHDNFCWLALNDQLGLHQRIPTVMIERIIRLHLIIPDHLTSLRPERPYCVSEEIVAFAVERIPRCWIANAPEDEIEFRIVGAGGPRTAPRCPLCIVGTGIKARLAGKWDSKMPP